MNIKKTFASLLFAALMLLSSCAAPSPVSPRAKTLQRDTVYPPAAGLLDPGAEVRGVWIATVGNINFPSKKGLSEDKLRAELDDIVKNCRELGLNTIFFQVRPAADALYKSELFPYSEFVSGKQGVAPDGGFDPLAYLLEIAHNSKINVHAWVNPLRVTYGSAKYPRTDINALAKGHPARENPEWVIEYADGKLYFDAGNPSVREYVASGVREIVSKYPVDGVVFDDYFYPYPVAGAEFDDSYSFSKWGSGNKPDWRRDNINALVKGCFEAVKGANDKCLFGISPFGIWQNDDGANGGSDTRGLEAYESLYCDALAWVRGGYVDYISPQLYWSFDTEAAPYGELSDWWNSVLDGSGVKLLISHGAYRYEEWEDPAGELAAQIEYSREALTYRGSVLYGYEAIRNNASDIRGEIEKAFESEIIYSDPTSNFRSLELSGAEDGARIETTGDIFVLSGSSDPTVPLAILGKKVNRGKDGEFSLVIDLGVGENTVEIEYGNRKISFTVVRTEG